MERKLKQKFSLSSLSSMWWWIGLFISINDYNPTSDARFYLDSIDQDKGLGDIGQGGVDEFKRQRHCKPGCSWLTKSAVNRTFSHFGRVTTSRTLTRTTPAHLAHAWSLPYLPLFFFDISACYYDAPNRLSIFFFLFYSSSHNLWVHMPYSPVINRSCYLYCFTTASSRPNIIPDC